MTYASTEQKDHVTIAISRADRSTPDTFVADTDEHHITVEPSGVLRIDLYGRTLLYAPSTWTRVYATVGEVSAP